MTTVNFDELATQAFAPGAGEQGFEQLFSAVFSLPSLHFIATGEMPDLQPFCGTFPAILGDVPAVVAFTDTERARKFIDESSEKFGSADKPVVLNSGIAQLTFSSEDLLLSVPMSSMLGFLEGLIPKGIVKIFFNPNKDSHGFNHELKMMRPIWEYLDGKGLIWKADGDSNTAEQPSPQAAVDFDALSRKTNEANAAREHFDDLFRATFALPEWAFIARGEAPNYNPYVASNQGVAGGQQMIRAFTDGKRLHRFAKENDLLEPDGNAVTLGIPTKGVIEYLEQFEQYGVHGVWFNSDSGSDGYFVPLKQLRVIKDHLDSPVIPNETADARQQQDNLASYGMSKTDDGAFDINLVINSVGALRFDASIVPFYEALASGLKDYQGTGDYVTLLSFDPSGLSQPTENVAQNEHGPYMRSRNFQYLNPKNGVHIAVASLHTSRLRHARSNAEMTVSVELCKNLDDQTGVLYHRFEGPRADIIALTTAFEPILARFDYDPVK